MSETSSTQGNVADPGHGERLPDPGSRLTRQVWLWLIIGIAAVALAAAGMPVLSAMYGVFFPFSLLLISAQCASLPVAVQRPWIAIGLSVSALLAAGLLTQSQSGAPWPVPVTVMITQILLCLLIALRSTWQTATAATVLSVAAASAALLLPRLDQPISSGAAANLITFASIVVPVSVVGIVVHQWMLNRSELIAQRETTAEVQERQILMDERHRIARELHDVVAHSLSVISVQASTARYRVEGVTEEIAAEFDDITGSARRSLTEMRGLLAILRNDDGERTLAPSPTLSQIPELIDTYRRGGTTVNFTHQGDLADDSSSDAVVLTTYRVIQEGLSNAVRHAPEAEVWVELALGEQEIRIEILNGPGLASDQEASRRGPGHGLVGMRERVQMVGGELIAGPLADGGYQVKTVLPLR